MTRLHRLVVSTALTRYCYGCLFHMTRLLYWLSRRADSFASRLGCLLIRDSFSIFGYLCPSDSLDLDGCLFLYDSLRNVGSSGCLLLTRSSSIGCLPRSDSFAHHGCLLYFDSLLRYGCLVSFDSFDFFGCLGSLDSFSRHGCLGVADSFSPHGCLGVADSLRNVGCLDYFGSIT
jgi:hypothetical protein